MLPKLKAIKLSKLQALLLLGGAFVLAVGIWTSLKYRLVLDATPGVPAGSVLAMQFLPSGSDPLSEASAKKAISALPTEAQQALRQAGPGGHMTLFAVPDQDGAVQWGLLEALNVGPSAKPTWRLVSKEVGAIGFVMLDGRKRPLEASFLEKNAFFRIGRTYRGLIGADPVMNAGRRMIMPLNQEALYLEKPEGASWGASPTLLSLEMQRFPALSSFWNLPGRVELSVSASHTDTVLQPFSLYYRPASALKLPRAQLETYAKELLADAFPHSIDIQLPDGSHMRELRLDSAGVLTSQQQNQFGDIVKFSYPGQKESLYAFYSKDGEAWLTTDLALVQSVLLGNIDAATPNDVCHKGGAGGFALVPGSFLPVSSGFMSLAVSIHNLETGLFTICGYY